MNNRTNCAGTGQADTRQACTRQRAERTIGQVHRRPVRGHALRFRVGLPGCLFFVALLALWLGAGQAVAQERTHQISWGHPNPNTVSRFVVLISPVEGTVAATREISVGKPSAQSVGALHLFSAVVSFGFDEYLAVAAVGHDGQRSTPSNWSGMPPSRPGQPLLVGP